MARNIFLLKYKLNYLIHNLKRNKQKLIIKRMSMTETSGFNLRTPLSKSQKKESVLTLQKELEQATKNLEIEKRKFMETEEDYNKILKVYNEERDNFNSLKRTRTAISIKTIPIKTNNLYNGSNKLNVDNEAVLGKISNIKREMDVLRRERSKHISLCDQLNAHIQEMQHAIKVTDQNIENIKMSSEVLKNQILQYRQKSMTDIKGFRNTFSNLSQNYFSDRKYLESQIKNSRLQEGQDFQVNALPILKQRLRVIIGKNKQKLKISNEYKKTSLQIRKMFEAIQDFKGQEEVQFIARQFVQKQNAIYKLEQYVSQLQNRLSNITKESLENITRDVQTQQLLAQQNKKIITLKEKQYQTITLQKQIQQVQNKVKNIQGKFEVISPMFQATLIKLRQSEYNDHKERPEEVKVTFTLMKSNLMKVLGEVEKYVSIIYPPKTISKLSNKLYEAIQQDDPHSGSPAPSLPVQQSEHTIKHQLYSYSKLKELASEFISSRTSFSDTKRK